LFGIIEPSFTHPITLKRSIINRHITWTTTSLIKWSFQQNVNLKNQLKYHKILNLKIYCLIAIGKFCITHSYD
jgi:hypothetical protein